LKYAIPVSEGRLASHFGQSTEFMLLDMDDKGKIIKKQSLIVAPHSCGALPAQLAGYGTQIVLAGGMGMGPRMAFEANHIEVVLGVSETDPEKAAAAHFKGTLKSGGNACGHPDTVCDHSDEHHAGHHGNNC